MPTLNNEMKRAIIMDHYSSPLHKKDPDNDQYQKIHMHSDNCIDDIDFYMLFDGDIVKDACFNGIGCTISTASTDILCELVIGKSKEDSLYIIDQYNHMLHEEPFDEDVLEEANAFINTSKQAARIRCATIGFRAATAIIKDEK